MRAVATIGVYDSSLDDFLGKLRRQHVKQVELASEYRRRYLTQILDRVDLRAFLESLPDPGVSALLCVERDAKACHRSLIAARLHARFKLVVVDL
ncbi:MAG: DUF488 family protein [Candidatus Dormibacter sp.]